MHLKLFWTLFKNIHCQGPFSLRPCISRPYCIYKVWNSTSWKLQNHNFFAIKVTKRPKHWNRLPKMIICLLPLMWLTWLTWPISTTATPRFFGYCHSNLSMSRKITSSKRIISYGNLINGLSINYVNVLLIYRGGSGRGSAVCWEGNGWKLNLGFLFMPSYRLAWPHF